jgi:hypothetical protein
MYTTSNVSSYEGHNMNIVDELNRLPIERRGGAARALDGTRGEVSPD